MLKIIVMLFFCTLGALLNIALSQLQDIFSLNLFLDTVFTITVTFLSGPLWGAVTGALTNTIYLLVRYDGWGHYLFALCNIAAALVTYLFMRFFPRELDIRYSKQVTSITASRRLTVVIDRIVVLIILSFAMCLVLSILGGLISFIIQRINTSRSGDILLSPEFAFSMFPEGLPVILKEILSRIPVNIIDRLISVFAGYGIAVLLGKLYKVPTEY